MATFNHKKTCNNIKQILLIMGLGMPLSPVRAELPDVSVFANAVEVQDSELAEMRGKFVSPDQITFFGVEMQTKWQTGSGEVLSAGMKMDMNFSKDGNTAPVVSLVPTVSIVDNSVQSIPSDTTITSKGINNISGAVQSIQAAGNENRINNTFEMDVAITSSPVNENAVSQPLAPNPFSVQKSTDNGSVALAGSSQKGIQVYTYVPNQGEILQRIGSSPAGDGQIMQSVRLVGDQHSVINTMSISAGFSAVDASTVQNTIQFGLGNFY